jgi:FkbM family methyltransferase
MGLLAILRSLKWRYRHLGIQKTEFGTRLKIKSYMDHLVFKEIFTDKIYDDFILQALEKTPSGKESKRIFDLGANLGFFTIRCCEIWIELGRSTDLEFVLYEPGEICVERLKGNLKAFNQKPFSFDIRNKLVGKQTGSDWFIEDKDHHLGQCISEKIEKKGHRYSRKVSYHDLTKDLEASKIDLLKCDIEGSEVDLLKSYKLSLEQVCSIIIETHGESAKDFVCKTLKEVGFVSVPSSREEEDSIFSNLFFINDS